MPAPVRSLPSAITPAVVTYASLEPILPGRYLLITEEGAAMWVNDPSTATSFESMREAARAAMRLPAHIKAFGMPREVEIHARQTLH